MRASWLLCGLLIGCSSAVPPDPGLEGLGLESVAPSTIIPGTKLLVKGSSFVTDEYGTAELRLRGNAGGASVDVSWPAVFIDFDQMSVAVDGAKIDQIGGDATFEGTASLEFLATSNGEVYTTDEVDTRLEFRELLTPSLTGIDGNGEIYVNEKIEIQGQGFLLGGDEGQTVVRVSGCFRREGQSTCAPITAQEIPLVPATPLDRTRGLFAFAPKIAGIQPGAFEGDIAVINQQVGKAPIADSEIPVDYTLLKPAITSVCVGDPCVDSNLSASLGQYVFISGGGFVGGDANQSTELELTGMFSRNGSPAGQVTLGLIPQFVEGALVRYVLDTQDAIGQSLDLFADTGTFSGTVTPITTVGATTVIGQAHPLTFAIGHVKQVVFLDYRPSYVEGLRDFGLRAADSKIRERVMSVLNEAYRGVNVEFRMTEPVDFKLYEHVEIVGRDPNGMGLFGYDNTAGKDRDNKRLYDRLGGVNADTQQDNYPGFGGVFLRSLLGFSKHPNGLAEGVPGADVVFDQIFDPFRPDVGGTPIRASDLSGVQVPTSGAACPASDRAGKVECAIWVLGNLVGGTMSHEIGHSLGLANPDVDEAFHNFGDEPNRLMDSGGSRPFFERAELSGQGPGVFCEDEYEYLRRVLPSTSPPNDISRPGCE